MAFELFRIFKTFGVATPFSDTRSTNLIFIFRELRSQPSSAKVLPVTRRSILSFHPLPLADTRFVLSLGTDVADN